MKVRDIRSKAGQRYEVNVMTQYHVQTCGEDNLYYETVDKVINASATGAECCDRYADFIEGAGIEDSVLASTIVNTQGDTIEDILSFNCRDIARFGGFSVHVNYDILGNVASLHYVPFVNCRLTVPDAYGYIGKIAIHPDWSGKKYIGGKRISVNKENIDYIDVFNPSREVVLSQIARCGGIEHYKGQVLWCSFDGIGVYPTPKADRVITEMSADEGLANVKYRNVRCNFFPAGMIVSRRGSASDIAANDGISIDEARSELDRTTESWHSALNALQGDEKTGKILEVEIENDEDEPKFVSLSSQNYDKEFSVTEQSITERIYAAYGQEPWYSIRIGKVGFSGNIVEDAFTYYNSIVDKQQRFIERAYSKMLGIELTIKKLSYGNNNV